MSRPRIAVVGTGPAAAATALELARGDDVHLVLVGAGGDVVDDVATAGALTGFEPRVEAGGWAALAGARVVVLLDGGPSSSATTIADAAPELARRCPDAIAVIATQEVGRDCHDLLDATRWPRRRVIGVSGSITAARARLADARVREVSVRDAVAVDPPSTNGPAGPLTLAAAVAQLVEAIVRDRHAVLECTVALHGEHGLHGVHAATVRVGRDGVASVL